MGLLRFLPSVEIHGGVVRQGVHLTLGRLTTIFGYVGFLGFGLKSLVLGPNLVRSKSFKAAIEFGTERAKMSERFQVRRSSSQRKCTYGHGRCT